MATAESKGKPAKGYDESQIKNLSGLKAVRAKPEMYVGEVDWNGVWTIIREPADNAVDEALAKRNNVCYIHIGKPGEPIVVADNGQGIPVGDIKVEDPVTHNVHKVPAFKAAMMLTHTGGKFDDKAYATSRGTHGIGVKATNALSKKFEAFTCYKDQWYSLVYEQGVTKQEMTKCKAPTLPNGQKPKRGTVIRFLPDEAVFGKKNVGKDGLKEVTILARQWAELSAYLVPKFKVILEVGGKTKTFYFENGFKDYLSNKVKKLECNELGAQFFHSSPLVDVALTFTDYDGDPMTAYTNGLLNIGGGTHKKSLSAALFKAIEPYMTRGKDGFTSSEVEDGLLGFINAKMSTPKFGGQTKEKLTDQRAGIVLRDELTKALSAFFAKHKQLAKDLCERAAKFNDLKADFKASKSVIKALKKVKQGGMPSKFAGANKAKAEDRETFIVEGDSAGGTAKQARNPDFQEVLPAKGKVMNAEKGQGKKGKDGKKKTALDSDEVIFILAAIGYDPNLQDPLKNLRTGKIILLSDPDPDGFHINLLELTLLNKYVPQLFDRGMIYVCDAPEYCATDTKGVLYTGNSIDEVKVKAPKGTPVLHLKGWGEAEPELLAAAAFHPATRKLIRIKAVDKAGRTEFQKLMGADTEYRKKLLSIGTTLGD